jgi:starch-binding outer membrane protein, SusD/RagB family
MKHLLLSIFCLLALSACDFLEQNSPNDLNAEAAITDAASAEAALLGVYSSMQSEAYYGGNFPLIGEALSGNAATGGYFYLSLDQLGAREVTPVNVIVEDLWIGIYRTIANANRLLEALPKINDLEPLRQADIEGQARTIRALAHFDLLRSFGEHWDFNSDFGIPLVTTVQGIEDFAPRATVRECYQFIISELGESRSLVGSDFESPQYVNAATVEALFARVYLYQKDIGSASTNAILTLANPSFSFFENADVQKIYDLRRTPESIFELAFDAQNRSAYNGLTYARPDALRPEVFYMAAQDLGDFFAARPSDARAALLDFDPAQNDATIQPDGRTQKYRGEDAKDNPAYIVRRAEMQLILAEAFGRTDGLQYLNALREKRGLAPLDPPATDEDFLNAILDERRAELNFEGHYYFDLARTGQYAARTGADDFRAILPIPNREIAASGGRYAQNPGY